MNHEKIKFLVIAIIIILTISAGLMSIFVLKYSNGLPDYASITPQPTSTPNINTNGQPPIPPPPPVPTPLPKAGYDSSYIFSEDPFSKIPRTIVGENSSLKVLDFPTNKIDTSNWLTYTDNNFDFSFKYPKEAIINGPTNKYAYSYNKVDLAHFNIEFPPYNNQDPYRKIFLIRKESFQEKLRSVNVQNQIKLGDMIGLYTHHEHNALFDIPPQTQMLFDGGGVVYSFSIEDDDVYKESLEQILLSFRLHDRSDQVVEGLSYDDVYYDTKNWNEYRNNKYGLKLNYPHDWKIVENDYYEHSNLDNKDIFSVIPVFRDHGSDSGLFVHVDSDLEKQISNKNNSGWFEKEKYHENGVTKIFFHNAKLESDYTGYYNALIGKDDLVLDLSYGSREYDRVLRSIIDSIELI